MWSAFIGREYKLTSIKLYALAVLIIVVLTMYHTLILYLIDKLSGDNIIRLFEITINALLWTFGIFVGGNIMSKPFQYFHRKD